MQAWLATSTPLPVIYPSLHEQPAPPSLRFTGCLTGSPFRLLVSCTPLCSHSLAYIAEACRRAVEQRRGLSPVQQQQMAVVRAAALPPQPPQPIQGSRLLTAC